MHEPLGSLHYILLQIIEILRKQNDQSELEHLSRRERPLLELLLALIPWEEGSKWYIIGLVGHSTQAFLPCFFLPSFIDLPFTIFQELEYTSGHVHSVLRELTV